MIITADIDVFNCIRHILFKGFAKYSISFSKVLKGYDYITHLPKEFLNMTQLVSIDFRCLVNSKTHNCEDLSHRYMVYNYNNTVRNHNYIRWINMVNIQGICNIDPSIYRRVSYAKKSYFDILKV